MCPLYSSAGLKDFRPYNSRTIENVTRARIHSVVRSKRVKYHFWVNYPSNDNDCRSLQTATPSSNPLVLVRDKVYVNLSVSAQMRQQIIWKLHSLPVFFAQPESVCPSNWAAVTAAICSRSHWEIQYRCVQDNCCTINNSDEKKTIFCVEATCFSSSDDLVLFTLSAYVQGLNERV